jgi:ATP-binding cassette subfamily B protein
MWGVIGRILKLSGDLAKRIKLSFLFSVLDAVFEMVPFVALFYFITQYQNGADLQSALGPIVLLLAAGILGRIVFKYLLYRFQSATGFEFVSRERITIGNHLRKVPMGFFHENSLGDITTTATTDLNLLEQYSMHILDRISTGTISMVVMSVLVFYFDWRIGIVFIAGIAIALLIYNVMQKKGKELAAKQKVAQSGAISATLEYLQGISVIKAFNMASNTLAGVNKAYEKSNKAQYNFEKTFAPLNAAYSIVFRVASCGILFLGSWLALGGEIDLARFIVIVVACFTVFNPLEVMGQMTLLVRSMEASLDRVERIKSAKQIDTDGKNIDIDTYDIGFEDVSFAYDSGEQILQEISFNIPQNTLTAIVGPSGSGKTTITRLIARFWDVQKGGVKVGKHDVQEFTCDSLLANISMVFQSVYLFHDSISANIRLGNPGATDEQVIEAAKAAQCHDFIMEMPDGYDTVVGEGGSTLSGGEKQRISIARAILKDAPIILLDEATASVDPENEVLIQDAIQALVRDKTLVVIAHRLSTVRNADQILVIDEGKVADRGTHDELIARAGLYKKFWEIRQTVGRWRLGKCRLIAGTSDFESILPRSVRACGGTSRANVAVRTDRDG